MKEPKPLNRRDDNVKQPKGTENDTKPATNINHEFTEQISLNSSDQNSSDQSSHHATTTDNTTNNRNNNTTNNRNTDRRVFSSKSMSEILKDDQDRDPKPGTKQGVGSNMEESSSCSYHEQRSVLNEKESVSLSELSDNIRSRTELLATAREPKDTQQKQQKQEKQQKQQKDKKEKDKKDKKEKDKKDKKKEEQIEIKRLKLISFLGNRINETPIEEIEEAISKMLFLTTKQFENLLEDVLNQIEERTLKKKNTETTNSLSSFSSKQSESKLVHLNTKQFKKLCLDVFYVFEAKYPSNKKNKYSELIQNIETSLKEMTSKMSLMDETSEVIFTLENEQAPSKQLSIFLDYVKKIFLSHNLETEVLSKFEEVYFQNTNMNLNLLDPEFLLKFTQNSLDMKVQAQRKILHSINKKYKKSLKKSRKLDSPYKYILRREVIGLVLLLETKKPTLKEILRNLGVLFDHLTYCCLNEDGVFSKEAFLLFECVLRNLKVVNEKLKEKKLEEIFVEFEEFNLKIKQEKLAKRVLDDEMERLVVNLARIVLELKVVY